jgi:hypothetical protein
MRVETGFPVRRTAASIHLTELPTGGYKALRDETSSQQRDDQIAAMCKRFGLPISAA